MQGQRGIVGFLGQTSGAAGSNSEMKREKRERPTSSAGVSKRDEPLKKKKPGKQKPKTGLTAFLSSAQQKPKEVETIEIESSEEESEAFVCEKCKTQIKSSVSGEHRDWHLA